MVPVLSRIALAVGNVLVASCGMSNAATWEDILQYESLVESIMHV
jgi:hypothetical protein